MRKRTDFTVFKRAIRDLSEPTYSLSVFQDVGAECDRRLLVMAGSRYLLLKIPIVVDVSSHSLLWHQLALGFPSVHRPIPPFPFLSFLPSCPLFPLVGQPVSVMTNRLVKKEIIKFNLVFLEILKMIIECWIDLSASEEGQVIFHKINKQVCSRR